MKNESSIFSNKKYDSYNVELTLSYANFFFLENLYAQFEGIIYHQIVGIFQLARTVIHSDLFLYCYERDFMPPLHKSKRYDLIDMFNDTFRYLDDILIINNPIFEIYN